MLFRGSKKYPEVDLFVDMIKKNNGSFNAYTSGDETNYHFSSSMNSFESILEVWSRFFIDPLLDPQSQQKEINAVQSEFDISTANPSYMIHYMTQNELANQDSLFSKFSCGNIQYLQDYPQKKGLDVYNSMVIIIFFI